MAEHLPIAVPLLLVFDGHCVLCNRTVRWLLRRDPHRRLLFAPSESPSVASLLSRAELPITASETIVAVQNPSGPTPQFLIRSSAVIAALAVLPRPWPAVAAALRAIPRPLRDFAYRLIARSRYRIWGRYQSCPLPAPEDCDRFL